MLHELPTSLLLPTELISATDSILVILEPVVATEPFLQKIRTTLRKDLTEMESVLLRDRSSETSHLLLEKDGLRDKNFIAFRDYVKACVRRPQENVAQAAEAVLEIIRKQGWTLYTLSYLQESAVLKLLFNDLGTPEATAAIQTIGAQTWLDDLKNAQTDFEETYQTRISAVPVADFPLLRETKVKLGRDLAALLEAIRILAGMDADNTFGPITTKINNVIGDIMTTVRGRKTREKKGNETAPEESAVVVPENIG